MRLRGGSSVSAEGLLEADTEIYLDCGTQDERGLTDQAEVFLLNASSALGPEQVHLERCSGDHGSQLYNERLYASMLWLGDIFAEGAAQAP